jgi:hypothetical protein
LEISYMKKTILSCLAVLTAHAASAQVHIIEDFSTNPISTGRWSFGAGSNAQNQFSWSATAPAYAGDQSGSLAVHLNSSLPSVRLQRSIGTTLSGATDFSLAVRFSFTVTGAPEDEALQIAFGLVQGGITGANRTGSGFGASAVPADVFHTVEFNYFPQLSTFDPSAPGPTLTPAVFGAPKGGNAFNNFASHFEAASDLGGNSTGIKALPQSQTLQATLAYTSGNETLTLTMHAVNADGSLTLLNTEVPPLTLATPPSFSNYDRFSPFQVDALAIMAYRDGYLNSPSAPSLVADLTFQRFELFSPIPEPGAALLLVCGATLLAGDRRGRSGARR